VKVAHYEVVGNDAKMKCPSRKPRKLAGQETIETFGSRARDDFSSTSNDLSSLRDGRRLK
jgi:hypothetical protein